MIVDSQVRQARVPALQNLTMNESRRQRPVAVSPGNVVSAKLGRVDMLNQQPQGRAVAHNAGAQNGAVFVLVSGEEMPHDSLVVPGSDQDLTILSSHQGSPR